MNETRDLTTGKPVRQSMSPPDGGERNHQYISIAVMKPNPASMERSARFDSPWPSWGLSSVGKTLAVIGALLLTAGWSNVVAAVGDSGTIAGRVTLPNGTTPVAGATVTAVGAGTYTSVTAADGTYSMSVQLSALQPDYSVRAAKAGYATSAPQIVSPSPTTTTWVNFVISPLFISGKVTLLDGTTPVAGATVTAVGPGTYTNLTAGDGTYFVGGQSNASYHVSAAKEGYWPSPTQTVVVVASPVAGINFRIAPVSLAEAVDATNLVWTTGGSAPWFGESRVTHDGVDAAQSGPITHSQEAWLEATVSGPGTLTFWWKVSCEAGFDWLRFHLDGVLQGQISGEVNWQAQSFSIAMGIHTLRWRYVKDVSDSAGQDCGWVDQVIFTSATGGPSIAAHPASQVVW